MVDTGAMNNKGSTRSSARNAHTKEINIWAGLALMLFIPFEAHRFYLGHYKTAIAAAAPFWIGLSSVLISAQSNVDLGWYGSVAAVLVVIGVVIFFIEFIAAPWVIINEQLNREKATRFRLEGKKD